MTKVESDGMKVNYYINSTILQKNKSYESVININTLVSYR